MSREAEGRPVGSLTGPQWEATLRCGHHAPAVLSSLVGYLSWYVVALATDSH